MSTPTITVGSLENVRAIGFPHARLVFDGSHAELGRLSWFSVFLGRGRRIRLTDGQRWRLRATNRTRFVCPVVVDGDGARLAVSMPGDGNYAIDTRDRNFSLNPLDGKPRRANHWILSENDEPEAKMTKRPFTIEATTPIPLAVVLLCEVLMKFGALGENELKFRNPWG